MIKATIDAFHTPNLPHEINHYRNDHKYRTDVHCESGLEKSSVLPVLDRFLSLETDFVLNRKQKNRSIKVRFFPSNSQQQSIIHTCQGNLQLTSHLIILFNPFVYTCIT